MIHRGDITEVVAKKPDPSSVRLNRDELAQQRMDRERDEVELERQGIFPLDRTPRPDGLAVDKSIESYVLKRLSPRRNRWPEVHEFDERVRRLEHKQGDLNVQLEGLREQHVQAEESDREALARWVAADEGERPLPAAPGVARRINELVAERDALTTAMQQALDDKTSYVEKHRGRLQAEAGKARRRAVERLHEQIAAVEEARREAVECCQAEVWAREFPAQQAHGTGLQLDQMNCGRIPKALPGWRSLTSAAALHRWLREDADWLDRVLEPKPEDDELDPDREAIWEQSDEGRQAIRRANERVAQGLAPRNVHTAGWEE